MVIGGAKIAESAAPEHVFGCAVGIDMTRRDLRGEAKKLGRPWEVAKDCEHSAPAGPSVPAAGIGRPNKGSTRPEMNGKLRRKDDLAPRIWNTPETLPFLRGLSKLAPGDLIFTGAPAGILPVRRGDHIKGGVEGVGEIAVEVV